MNLELLAPGGSVEGMRCAVNQGADAIYMGGQLFGARAYADNPDQTALLEAMDYCHLHGVKMYLTVNTLLKQRELQGKLYDYMLPLYENGLDAVLVQDLGVLRFLRREFRDLPLHASTQMSVQSVDGARFLKELGAERIVPARELSLKEIAQIHREVDIEIESFIHGALCYCYSGQCLMSSMIGGRSGNRGRCAQPCRQMYRLEERGKVLSKKSDPYLLSLKDSATLQILPELIEAGVCSFKMEGRMKRPEYAAGITAIYRKYMDRYLQHGRDGYYVEEEDVRDLMDLYNRGGFSEGYYKIRNGKNMMSMNRPNHAGTDAGKVIRAAKGQSSIRALEDLYAQDVLDINDGHDITLGSDVKKGETFSLRTSAGVQPGQIVHRVRSERLLAGIREACGKEPVIPVKGMFSALAGERTLLQLHCGAYEIRVEGEVPQTAERRETTPGDVEKQLRKTGGTAFGWEMLDVHVDSGLFIPLTQINEMRRGALHQLQERIITSERRSVQNTVRNGAGPEDVFAADNASEHSGASDRPLWKDAVRITALVRQDWQIKAAAESEADRVILDSMIWLDQRSAMAPIEAVQMIRSSGKTCMIALPPLWREDVREKYVQIMGECSALADGLLLRHQDQILFGRKMKMQYGLTLQADHSIYTWNREAVRWSDEVGLDLTTIPLELNRGEVADRTAEGAELVIYGYAPLMVTANCLMKNTAGCRKKSASLTLIDKKNAFFRVETHCGICCNIIYNHIPLDLSPVMDQISRLQPGSVRLDFTRESADEVTEMLHAAALMRAGDRSAAFTTGDSTRGHFKRGTE